MQRPFHYAFPVRNLAETRRFYGEILGCPEGRSSDTWIDFDFFGNQLSAHLCDKIPDRTATSRVDNITVPIPHFGAVLHADQFDQIAKRFMELHTKFVIPPRIRFEGRPGEHKTMFLLDPSGNALEFKTFRNAACVFEP